MNRILCLLLSLALLSSVLLPVTAAIEKEVKDLTLIAPKDGAVEVDTDRLLHAASPKRGELEDNLVFPGPLVEKSTFVPNGKASIPLGVYMSGKPGQYMCMMIYAGPSPTGDPIASSYAPFDSKEGLGTYYLDWKKNNVATGRYTLVTFTAELEGETLYPVNDTAFMTDIYVYETYQTRWHSFVMDPKTKQRLDTITLPMGQTTVLAAGRSPLPCYGTEKVSLGGSMIQVEEAGGYFFVTPVYCGTDRVLFYYGSGNKYIPIEVCYREGGHQNIEEVFAGDPTKNFDGCTLRLCELCGQVTRDYTSSFYTVFRNFNDVPKNSWYYSSVEEAVTRNLFKGVSTKSFGPEQSMTRAMLVTVLWRYEGEPEADSAEFTDVAATDWFAKAVYWAAEQGIVNGIGKNRFDPNGTITREQLATILYRYCQKKGLNTVSNGDPNQYPDGGELSSWAAEAMAWALDHKLISGVGKGNKVYLRPLDSATRAQVSTILVRFIQNLIEFSVLPDLSNAVDSGRVQKENYNVDITWAYYEGGKLQIGGTLSGPWGFTNGSEPWYAYRDQITEVEILFGIERIYSGAFREYPALGRVTMADSVVRIDGQAFYHCPKLWDIRFSSNLRYIGVDAFRQCSSLKEVTIPDSCPLEFDTYAFADNGNLEKLTLGKNVRKIGISAFENCTALKEVELPDSILGPDNTNEYGVHGIGVHAFYGCSSLERVKLPVGLRNIQSGIFYNCTSLRDVEMPYAAEMINNEVFRNCTSLESMILGPTLKKLYTGCFVGCTSLKEVYVLSWTISLYPKGEVEWPTDEDRLPFGDPDQVVVYGFLNSPVQSTAEKYGYAFRDVMEVMTP